MLNDYFVFFVFQIQDVQCQTHQDMEKGQPDYMVIPPAVDKIKF